MEENGTLERGLDLPERQGNGTDETPGKSRNMSTKPPLVSHRTAKCSICSYLRNLAFGAFEPPSRLNLFLYRVFSLPQNVVANRILEIAL